MNDLYYLRLATLIAREKSQDQRTQNAAVLVPAGYDGRVYLGAANGYLMRSWASGEKLLPPAKYEYIEHAERRVIYDAARSGYQTAGATLYALWFSCPDCARGIIASGITTVVGTIQAREATPARWEEAVKTGESMLRDAGVNMRWVSDKVGQTILFDGRELFL
jgi:deoxycytidylate deaminase